MKPTNAIARLVEWAAQERGRRSWAICRGTDWVVCTVSEEISQDIKLNQTNLATAQELELAKVDVLDLKVRDAIWRLKLMVEDLKLGTTQADPKPIPEQRPDLY